MPELLNRAPPVVRRAAGFQQYGGGRPRGEEPQEPGSAQPMLFSHVPGAMRDRHLKDGLGEVDGDGRLLHGIPSFAVAQRPFRYRHDDAAIVEESIPSLLHEWRSCVGGGPSFPGHSTGVTLLR